LGCRPIVGKALSTRVGPHCLCRCDEYLQALRGHAPLGKHHAASAQVDEDEELRRNLMPDARDIRDCLHLPVHGLVPELRFAVQYLHEADFHLVHALYDIFDAV